ncbi:hypothetical protein MIND_00838200 [Mycena indigotica]|uniref:Uncharacterized protein n=1 Tax=Mycena indigotica TaxID=2126181 RepID=A0A8H6SID2_9AGAR|nr:uncharacterized protein MIND_00838200 [Mycena indigotica]KAF7298902.1 hypothetical protein MIND_00838200 [Mycena indigotica]
MTLEDGGSQLCVCGDTTVTTAVRSSFLQPAPSPTMALSRAQELCVACATDATLGHAQRAAIALVELCIAVENAQSRRKRAVSMATLAVEILAPILQKAHDGDLSVEDPALKRLLKDITTTLGRMRSFIEQHPGFLKRPLESFQLKQKLKKSCKAVLKHSQSPTPANAKTKTVLEVVGLSAQVAAAVCDAPVLNAFKPIANVVALISNRAMAVKANREAATALTQHAENVTTSVLKHAVLAGGSEPALEALQSALQDAATLLDDRRGKYTAWLSATSDSARFASVSAKLDKALAVYTARETVETKAVLCRTTAQVSRLISVDDRRLSCTQLTLSLCN